MRSKSVAVLSVRSSELTAVVAERGVNNTFIIKSKYSRSYDGFAEGEFLDASGFVIAVTEVVKNIVESTGGIKSFYVGVPGEFLKLVNVEKSISFSSSKKIAVADCQTLISTAAPPDNEKWRLIRRSCLYYTLSDKRKIINPEGAISDGLQGKFCFFQCANSFIGCLMDAFKRFGGIGTVNLIPENFAEAMYLLKPERRDDCAVLFDFGFISSTFSVVCGNGLLYSESFSVGIGHVAMFLMTELEIPFEVAQIFLKKINLNAKENLSGTEECVFEGKRYAYSRAILRDKIREGLDGVCETVEECRRNFVERNLDGKPLLVTGEGVNVVRGTAEHISGRLVTVVETAVPEIPYFDKPEYGALFGLLSIAIDDKNNQ